MLDLLQGLCSLQDTLFLAAADVDSASLTGATSRDMVSLFSIQGLLTLGMLVVLQAVLGFDNLLYISIESKRVPEDQAVDGAQSWGSDWRLHSASGCCSSCQAWSRTARVILGDRFEFSYCRRSPDTA